MTIGDIEAHSDLAERQTRKEQVVGWLEKGLDGSAVCSYGTSVEELLKILKLGKIASAPVDPRIPYQNEITDGGRKNLYFLTPFLPRIHDLNPKLAAEIEEEFDSSGQAALNLDIPNSIELSRNYAMRNAVKDSLFDVELIADGTVPIEDLQRAQEEGDVKNIIGEVKDDLPDDKLSDLSDLEEKLKDPQVSKRIKEALARKGVLIYFNKGLFDKTVSYSGDEDPNEFMIVSDSPLDLSVISGIEIGTEVEKKEVLASL